MEATKTEKLQEVFNTMVYGENLENTSQANEWLQNIEIVDKSSDIDNILKNLKVTGYSPERQHLVKLAKELEKNINIISQIEILSRGVLLKDTKKAVDLLAQYFYYNASCWTSVKISRKGINVGVFEDDHPLWILGLFLAPALAFGGPIVLQTGTKFAAVVTYILELAKKAGIPDDAILLIPSNEGELQPYLSDSKVSRVAIFVDLLNEKYRGINRLHKKILVFSGYKTPMLVFENADLDSAVESVIDAAWGYQGMLPWSIDTILVQENILHKFTEKLKSRLKSVKIGNGDDKMADISYPNNPKVIQNLNQAVDKAKLLGIEVFQMEHSGLNNFTPTLIIGSKVNTNNVVSPTENNSAVTLLAFRSIDEAVSLANNTRQGLGASVWSENIGLVNEVARKLKVGNVWINSHGLFSPEVPLVPVKDSGIGYFGEREGLFEYHIVRLNATQNSVELPTKFKSVDAVKNAISSGKTASAAWSKATFVDKVKKFQELEDFLDDNKNRFLEKLPDLWLDEFKKAVEMGMVFGSSESYNSTHNGYNMSSIRSPKGVLVLEMKSPVQTHNTRLLFAAIIEGNAVILLNEPAETQEIYNEVSKKLPAGVLTVLPYSLDAVKTASQHKELNGYFSKENIIFGSIPLRDSKIFNLDDTDYTLSSVSVVKNVWSNIGQSSQCNL